MITIATFCAFESLVQFILIQCKDVGCYYTCLELAFSMGTFVWKVSQILIISKNDDID